MPKSEGIIQSYIHRILGKVNQIICIMYPNSMPHIMILAQGVLQTFCRQDCFTKCRSRKNEIMQPNIYRILPNVNQVIYTLDTICEPNIMNLAKAVLQILDILLTRLHRFTISKSKKTRNSV